MDPRRSPRPHRHHDPRYDDDPHHGQQQHHESLRVPMPHYQSQHPDLHNQPHRPEAVSSPVSTWTAVRRNDQSHHHQQLPRSSSTSLSSGGGGSSWLLVPEGQQPPQHLAFQHHQHQMPNQHYPHYQHHAANASSSSSRPVASAATAPPRQPQSKVAGAAPVAATPFGSASTAAAASSPSSSRPTAANDDEDEETKKKKQLEEAKRLEDIKAAARAYALSSQTSTRRRSRKKKGPQLQNYQPYLPGPSMPLLPPPPPPPPPTLYPHPLYNYGGSHPHPGTYPHHYQHHHPYSPSTHRRTSVSDVVGTSAPHHAHHHGGAVPSVAAHPPSNPTEATVPMSMPPPRDSHGNLDELPAMYSAKEPAESVAIHDAPEVEPDNNDNDSVDEEYLQFVRGLGASWGQGGGGSTGAAHPPPLAADDPLGMGLMEAMSVAGDVQCSALDAPDDDDDDEFRLESSDDDDEEEEEIDEGDHDLSSKGGREGIVSSRRSIASAPGKKTVERRDGTETAQDELRDDEDVHDDDDDDDDDWALGLFDTKDLEWELNLLEQEDMEAAVATLLLDSADTDDEGGPKDFSAAGAASANTEPHRQDHDRDKELGEDVGGAAGDGSREKAADRMRGLRLRPNRRQHDQLRELLQKHYQLLLQQSVLAARLAHRIRSKPSAAQPAASSSQVADGEALIPPAESAEDLAEILDAAVGMLQDLDQNRKDAIRHYVQFSDPAFGPSREVRVPPSNAGQAQKALWSSHNSSGHDLNAVAHGPASPDMRRLTRSQFSKTLSSENREGEVITVFAIPGITKLKDTFAYIDMSVSDATQGSILAVPTHGDACRQLLGHASANYDQRLIPGTGDLSNHFLEPSEHLGPSFKPPSTLDQDLLLRRNRAFFTVGEDSLVLRGVNLYGEKQWGLVCSRFLPNRSPNVVAQRYGLICVHLYKAHGIGVDGDGEFETPPEHFSIDDVDQVKLATIEEVKPPAIINVHRWSLDEDLSLLRAVPIMGNMWAEIAARVLPHRDRGHIRKRYQVLSRRVKTAVQRMNNNLLTLVEPTTRGKTPPRLLSYLRGGSCESERVSPGTARKAATPKAAVCQSSLSGRKATSPHARVPRVSEALTPRLGVQASGVGGAEAMSRPQGRPKHVAQRPLKAATPLAPRPCATPTRNRSLTPKEHPSGAADGASRAAFEQLVELTGPECSQMRRIGNMMSKDDAIDHGNTSVMTAGTVLAQLAAQKDPNSSMDYFPDMNLGDDPSGLSVLRSSLGTSREKGPHDRKHGFSAAPATFLTGVLDRTRQRQSNETRPARSQPSSSATLGGAEADRHLSPSTPSKRREQALDSSNGLPPFFSPDGAPNTMFSPPLTVDRGHSLWGGLSLLNAPDADASKLQVLPPARPLEALARERRGSRLEDNTDPPLALAVSRRTSLEAASLEGHSTRSDHSSSSPFSARASLLLPPEPSIPPFGGGTPSSSTTSSRAGTGTAVAAAYGGSPLMDTTTGMLLMETDLEAISALNSLSHSPPEALGGPRKRPAAESAEGNGVAGRGARQSLFSRVVGWVAGGPADEASEAATAAATATAIGDRDRQRRRSSSTTSRPVVSAKKRRLHF